MSDGSPEDVSKNELWERVKRLEKHVFPSRRQMVKTTAGAAGFTTLGFGAGNASAQASTEDGDGNVGDPSDRVDVFGDGGDFNIVSPDEVDGGVNAQTESITVLRDIYIIDAGTFDPADYPDDALIAERES